MTTPDITKHAAPSDWHDERFREGWDCALAAVALDEAQTHQLPATLASVDDVRRVCIAAGLADGDLLWSDETCHVTADVGYEWPGSTEALEAVYVERADDTDVSRVHAGASAALLWHSIQAARSAS